MDKYLIKLQMSDSFSKNTHRKKMYLNALDSTSEAYVSGGIVFLQKKNKKMIWFNTSELKNEVCKQLTASFVLLASFLVS